jgi:hypothetical protein
MKTHSLQILDHLTDVMPYDASIAAWHDDLMKCTDKGIYRVYFKNARGKKIRVYFTDVLHVPGLNFKLFSITKCINKPKIQFQGTHTNLFLLVKAVRINFDKQLTYGTGTLYASDITTTAKQTETSNTITEGAFAIINFDKFHIMMGHPLNEVLKETAQANKIQLTGVHHCPCTHCTEVKIRMKNIPKKARKIATKKGERLLLDLFWIKIASFAHNRYWLLIMDEYTHFLWSYFLKSKDENVLVIFTHLIHIRNDEKVKVKFIRCDN